MKKEIIKKILMSRKMRKLSALSMFVMAISVASPWDDKL